MLYWITTILLFLASFSTYELSVENWDKKNMCPKIVGIPSCYILFIGFIIAFVCHFLNTLISNQIYFIFIGISGVVALIASISELARKTTFPKTEKGTPICYYLLACCVALVITKQLSF